MHGEDNELEQILSDAISSYVDVEPREGLEGRILGSVRAEKVSRRRAFSICGLALAAGVTVIMLLRPSQHQERPAIVAGPIVAKVLPAIQVPKARLMPHRARRRIEPIKLRVFPAPSAVTSEERNLLAFVAQDPAARVQVLRRLREKKEETIEIPPIVIAPIEVGEEEK